MPNIHACNNVWSDIKILQVNMQHQRLHYSVYIACAVFMDQHAVRMHVFSHCTTGLPDISRWPCSMLHPLCCARKASVRWKSCSRRHGGGSLWSPVAHDRRPRKSQAVPARMCHRCPEVPHAARSPRPLVKRAQGGAEEHEPPPPDPNPVLPGDQQQQPSPGVLRTSVSVCL